MSARLYGAPSDGPFRREYNRAGSARSVAQPDGLYVGTHTRA